jgi:parvulin-like peptidyl-prolyl cis-trans isomerase-like protein
MGTSFSEFVSVIHSNLRLVLPTMVRHLQFVCVLVLAPFLALAQQQQQVTPPPAQGSQPPAGNRPQPIQPPTPVAPDAPVITIHGLCPAADKAGSCSLVLTRTEFETLVTSINTTNQTYTMPALRSLAGGYVTILTLADAAEKAGVDKDPRFQELMKVTRARTLADAYRRYLQEKYSNPSPEEIAEYYKQNINKFEQQKVDRIMVPRVNPKRPQEKRAEWEKKARDLAAAIRERAARGEDVVALQVEVYKTLGLNDSQPPQTEIPGKGAFPPAVDQDIKALKPGEVTKVEFEPSGFNIYKLRSRSAVPIEAARAQIVREYSQQKIDAEMKALTGRVHSDFNEQYFDPHTSGGPRPQRVPSRVAPMGNAPQANVPTPRPAPTPAQQPAPPK